MTIAFVNANMMKPPIAPLALDYIGAAAQDAGCEARIIDLCLADDADKALRDGLIEIDPRLVAVSFRNVDDCFWPSARSFIPEVKRLIERIRQHTDAPVAVGGVGFSIFARSAFERLGSDFGVRGDGEAALVALAREIEKGRRFDRVPGLIWRDGERIHENPPAWPMALSVPSRRDLIDNVTYFREGGQVGVETKRGCDRHCAYCADPLAKGAALRTRDPVEVADEFEGLIERGVYVFHLCDAEFNIPRAHALAVCEEINRRALGDRMRWYGYLSVVPFDGELAEAMREAGCVGINFTTDSASDTMLRAYGQPYRKEDIAGAVRLCRGNGIAVMLDLLLGGPGETPKTVAETIEFMKRANPDCVGAALGLRVYPGAPIARAIAAEGPMERNAAIHRRYGGAIDLLQPTFYISRALGDAPASLVRDLIGADERFFKPEAESDATGGEATDHNYNDNADLVEAIRAGARGAYWDILRTIRG